MLCDLRVLFASLVKPFARLCLTQSSQKGRRVRREANTVTTGTEVTLDAGAYNVTESGPSGYTASFSADCSGSLSRLCLRNAGWSFAMP
jgi:hypothetical protein